MRKLFSLLAFVVLAAATMFGQATRTWVSGVGDDANPCSRTAPCKTFAGAISKTAPQGEIDALDPGGFGALTITKPITLDGGGGQVASVLVAGTNGIVVAAGASDNVVIRNLRLDGLGPGANAGLDGIKFISGHSLTIQNCFIFGFQNNGINIATSAAGTQVIVEGTSAFNNTQNGLNVTAGAGVQVAADGSHFDNNGQFGVLAGNNSNVTIANSTASGNVSVGFLVSNTAAGTTFMHVSNSVAANNVGVGIQAGAGGSTAPSQATVSGTTLSGNGIGFVVGPNGTIKSFGNNSNTDGGSVTLPNLSTQ